MQRRVGWAPSIEIDRQDSLCLAAVWRWNAQVVAAWAYIVTWHNFHGSSGFGESYADSINPDGITLPYEDTLLAARYLAAQPYVDAQGMAAGGGSYGGYLIAAVLGRKHPFKALIAHAPEYNSYTNTAPISTRNGPDSFTTGKIRRSLRSVRHTAPPASSRRRR